MAARRIYQIAKELECEEKEIIEFLTNQGIKVSNRLSAITEEQYRLVRDKFTAPPPEPEPVPEPEPEPEPVPEPAPVAETPAQAAPPEAQGEQPQPSGKKKKKKKKNKNPQPGAEASAEDQTSGNNQQGVTPVDMDAVKAATQEVYGEAIAAGNEFIKDYFLGKSSKKKYKLLSLKMTPFTDAWSVMGKVKFDAPDTSPARYWQCVNKLTTGAFQLVNEYGTNHKEILAEMRELTVPIGSDYTPREIFTDEENLRFEAHQKLVFRLFGHGMGAVNDNLYALKMHAEQMKNKYEMMDFVEYINTPDSELRSAKRAPFAEVADAIALSLSGIVRRMEFYVRNKDRVTMVLENFFAWIDGYAKLKEQGADADKLEKYLKLQQKFMDLVEYMSFDNLISKKPQKPSPFDKALEQLNIYRDNIDDPDAERNFKYKIRGIVNIIYKPKDFIFLYQFAELEARKDYRPPEEIAAAEAAKAAAEAQAQAEAQANDSAEAQATDVAEE